MSDLIRREEVIKRFKGAMKNRAESEHPMPLTEERIVNFLKAIPSADNSISLLPNGELLVDTEYTDQVESVRLMNFEGFTRVFEERKEGRWMNVSFSIGKCSECGFSGGNCYVMKYCPNCGAKMERSE